MGGCNAGVIVICAADIGNEAEVANSRIEEAFYRRLRTFGTGYVNTAGSLVVFSMLGEENVAGLEVSMDDSLGMEVLDSR